MEKRGWRLNKYAIDGTVLTFIETKTMLQLEVIGNLGSDAEVKDFGGTKYVQMNVAHSEKHKDGNESTIWVSALWYGEGGSLLQYLKKGAKVFLRGRLVPKAYIDKNNQIQCAVNMYVNEVNLCGGSKPENANTAEQLAQEPQGKDDDMPF